MNADIEVAAIGEGKITAEGDAIRCGGRLLYVLQEGETWAMVKDLPGIIVTHPDTQPSWIKFENGIVVATEITPADTDGKHG